MNQQINMIINQKESSLEDIVYVVESYIQDRKGKVAKIDLNQFYGITFSRSLDKLMSAYNSALKYYTT